MYYLFIWQDSSSSGTFLACRSNDLQEFYLDFKEIIKRYIPYKGLFKVTKVNDTHILSYCDNAKAFASWYNSTPTGKVDLCEIVGLDKVFDLL